MFRTLNDRRGFTITELLVAMGLSAIVMASIGAVFYQQQKSFLVQEQLAAAQQSARAVVYFLEREIRSAGYDPTQDVNPAILVAGSNSISFQLDDNGNGVIDGDETITYSLYDSGGDGDTDIGRNPGTGTQPLALNVDALNFVYLDGASPPNVLDDDGLGNVVASISQIRSVEVTVVARTGREDPGYMDTTSYTNLRDQEILAAQNDHFRRRVFRTTISCRNL
jgi:type IV pilus assembly protein PilW